METKTGKVAVVNGIAYPSNVNYQYGFEAGVNYANAKLSTKAQYIEISSYAGKDTSNKNVGGNYIGNFNDPDTGKVVGEALIKQGVDILFVAAGNSGNGVFTAAKEAKGVKVIGCDVDQYNDGKNGDSNIVLTSVLKNMNTIIIDGLAFALPLFIIAIGGIFSERSGITNLALEGFLGFGAFFGAVMVFIGGEHM